MNKCSDCKNIMLNEDKYCRYCGYKKRSLSYFLLLNIIKLLLLVLIVVAILIFGISIYINL